MEIPDDVFERVLEEMRQLQLGFRTIWTELEKLKQEPGKATSPTTQEIEPPTEKQIQFLRDLGVEDIPPSKEEARQLLHELNEKLETGEYVIPPTSKQLKFLKDLGYSGPVPESKQAAWKLLQGLKTY